MTKIVDLINPHHNHYLIQTLKHTADPSKGSHMSSARPDVALHKFALYHILAMYPSSLA